MPIFPSRLYVRSEGRCYLTKKRHRKTMQHSYYGSQFFRYKHNLQQNHYGAGAGKATTAQQAKRRCYYILNRLPHNP